MANGFTGRLLVMRDYPNIDKFMSWNVHKKTRQLEAEK